MATRFSHDPPTRPPGDARPPGPDGQRPRFVMPLMQALDPSGDGTIDEKEIANATAALKKMDKNGDGKLTPDELRPSRPEGPRRGPGDGGVQPNRPPGNP